MIKKLGIFLDTNSVNWTLMDIHNDRLIDIGVYVFKPGCDNYGSGRREVSKNYSRRIIRMKRVRYARIRMRKYHLLKQLISYNMCPMRMESLEQWKRSKQFPFDEIREWMQTNSYALRAKAVNEEISLFDLGRILYQITCHRGYRFGGRNSQLKESVLSNGNPKERKIGYRQTADSIGKNTLGVYLNSILPEENTSYTHPPERIRNRVCTLEMYNEEIHKIWKKQAQFHSNLSQELRDTLIGDPDSPDPGGILFYFRPLKSQKHRVGNCLYEKNKTRCCVSSLVYQELEAWKWANTIEINQEKLSFEDLEKAAHFYLSHYRFQFAELKQFLQLPIHCLSNYKNSENIIGSFVNAELSKPHFFGNSWFEMQAKYKEDIYHALYFFSSKHQLALCAEEKFGLKPRNAQQFSRIRLDRTYALLSQKAARNILYFLKQGHKYKTAVYLAGVKNAISKEKWNSFSENDRSSILQIALNIFNTTPSTRLLDALKTTFKESFGFDHFNEKKLYGFTRASKKELSQKYMPLGKEADYNIRQLKNAILTKSVFAMRRVVNQIIKEHGAIDHIACELSVNLKINRIQRFIFQYDQKRIKQNRLRHIEHLKILGENILPLSLLKYDLWEECSRTCPYSGKEISLEILFSSHVQVVYIHPWSRSLNDSQLNKTLCITEIAEQLNERTPQEFFDQENLESWEEVKKRASRLFVNSPENPKCTKKLKRFIKRYIHRDLLKRQFQDPHQLSRNVAELLSQVTDQVEMMPGNITQHIMEEWLLRNVFSDRKGEYDFRINVLKAYVNARCEPKHVLHLKERNKYLRQVKKVKFPLPNEGYLDHLEAKVKGILVSYEQSDKLFSKRIKTQRIGGKTVSNTHVAMRGMLHKELLYGKRTPPDSKEAMHIRRPLSRLSVMTQVEKIVDPIIRSLVQKKLKQHEIHVGKIPQGVLLDYNAENYPVPQIFLPNKKGDEVPVYKVRMREKYSNAIQLKPKINGFAVPRNNHHITISMDNEGAFHEEVVTFWEAAQRYRQGLSVYKMLSKNEGQIITHLHINDLFLMGIEEEEEDFQYLPKTQISRHLYRVQKLSSNYYEFRIAYKQINSETQFPEYIRINNFGHRKTGWNSYKPIKVALTATGNLIL